MSELSNYIINLNSKLQQLLKQYELLQTTNAKQKEQISQLQKEKELFGEKLETLHQQNLLLKAAVTEMPDAEKKELEQRLNQYIKNIDKCISLLSQ